MPPRRNAREMKKLKDQIAILAQSVQFLCAQQTTIHAAVRGSLPPHRHRDPPPTARFKVPIREFHGTSKPTACLEWLHTCEQHADFITAPTTRRVSLVAKCLRGHASTWWRQLKVARSLQGKPKITDWHKFRKYFTREFIPKNYTTPKFQKSQDRQGTRTIAKQYHLRRPHVVSPSAVTKTPADRNSAAAHFFSSADFPPRTSNAATQIAAPPPAGEDYDCQRCNFFVSDRVEEDDTAARGAENRVAGEGDRVAVKEDRAAAANAFAALPQHIRPSSLGELERTHLNCFPELGRIRVNSLTVKQKSCFYHLSESLPLKYAFSDSSEGTWFLQMDAQPQCVPNPTDNISPELRDPLIRTDKKRTQHKRKRVGIWSFSFLKAALLRTPEERRRKKRKRNRKRGAEVNQTTMDVTVDSRNETFSESASISGIINKYFSDYDEVASNPFGMARSRHECKKYLNRRSTEYKYAKPEVGKRFVLALDNIGLSPSNQRPALSLSKSPFCKSAAVVRNLVFEMAEGSD